METRSRCGDVLILLFLFGKYTVVDHTLNNCYQISHSCSLMLENDSRTMKLVISLLSCRDVALMQQKPRW